jgi:hypothetical protein
MKKYFTLVIFCCFVTAYFLIPANAGGTDAAVRLKKKSIEALAFCKQNNFNTDFCILIDLKEHSGKKRACLWSFKKDSVLLKGMCSHGCGNKPWGETSTKDCAVFSNVPESHCSSLGKYKVSKRGYSSWGINVNYQLIGLDPTNSNALKRLIVLHSWADVPAEEVFPSGVPEGWGCPAVSNVFMKELDTKLRNAEKPVLLWTYN